jgi:uncharacterized protein YndB with AHSA1/START domain
MAQIHNDVLIARPAEDVWAVLGDLGNLAWVPGMAGAKVEDGRRICTTADGAEIHEEIKDYSDEKRSYSYVQTVHPLGLKTSRGTVTVAEAGDGARVEWTSEIEFADEEQESQFLPMLEHGYAGALQALKTHLEESG